VAASRSTFRERAGAVCWQKQLRDRYAAEGTPPVPHLDLKRAIVRPVSRRCAEQVILKYEWLGTMAATSLHYGIFFGAYCAGVCCVGGPVTAGIETHHQFGLKSSGDLLTLARGACVHWAPKGSNSKLVSWAVRLLATARRGKVLIAYSDTDAGEVGTIYQACNWAYVGTTSRGAEAEIVAPNGRAFNCRIVGYHARRRGVTYSAMRAALLSAGWRFQASNPKHKYVAILDRSDAALAARVARMTLPYPKRAGRLASEAPAPQAGQGGATPTPALPEAVAGWGGST
jgi:hypothetical protein